MVPSDLASRITHPPSNPQYESSERIKHGLGDIINNPKFSDDEKYTRYVQDKQNYLVQKHYLSKPLRLDIGEEERGVTDEVDDSGKSGDALTSVINSFKLKQPLALDFTAWLVNVPDLGWNSRGEISVKGIKIPGSSLFALINDVITPSPSTKPLGYQHFAHLLKRHNVPNSLVRETSGVYHDKYSALRDIDAFTADEMEQGYNLSRLGGDSLYDREHTSSPLDASFRSAPSSSSSFIVDERSPSVITPARAPMYRERIRALQSLREQGITGEEAIASVPAHSTRSMYSGSVTPRYGKGYSWINY